MYALTGYDKFNTNEEFYIKKLLDGELEFDIPRYSVARFVLLYCLYF